MNYGSGICDGLWLRANGRWFMSLLVGHCLIGHELTLCARATPLKGKDVNGKHGNGDKVGEVVAKF